MDEIAAMINISHESAHSIITDHLGFRKICARWVPRLFTQNQKQWRMEICQRLLERYELEGDAFLHRIVTCDESWAHHYTLESKRASMDWRRSGEHFPVKTKTKLLAGKDLTTFFWD